MQNNLKMHIERTVDFSKLDDVLMQLSFINDNLHIVRTGIIEGEINNLRMIDNALYLINQNIDELIKVLESAY